MADFNVSELDSVIHVPARLGVVACLQIHGPLDFTTLKERVGATDGALGAHLLKLEASGYIECKKSFVGRRPKSTYRLLPEGRKAFAAYLKEMQKVIDAAAARTRRADMPHTSKAQEA